MQEPNVNCLKSYRLAAKLLGVFPSCVGKTNVILKILVNFYSFFMLILPLAFALASQLCKKEVPLMHELWKMISVIGCICMHLQLLFQVMKKSEIEIFMSEILFFDRKCRNCGIFTDQKLETRMVRFWMGAILIPLIYCLITVPLVRLTATEDETLILNLAHSYQLFMEYFFVSQFALFTMLIRNRVDKITKYLKSYIWTSIMSEKCLPDPRQFVSLFQQLCKIIRMFNEVFSLSITFTLINLLMNEILSMYSFVYYIYKTKEFAVITDIFINGGWLIMNMILTVIICKSGHSVQNQTEKIESTILEFIDFNKSESFTKTLETLHYRVKNTNKRIENIFFTINWKLLFMVSSLCSALI